MAPPWVHCSLLIIVLNLLVVFAAPAQKYSPGIVINPTANQSPGKVTGILQDSSVDTAPVSSGGPVQAPMPVPVRTVVSQPAQAPVYVQQPASQYYSSPPQPVGQPQVVYVQPNDNRVQPGTITIRNGFDSNPSNNYYNNPPSQYYSSPPANNYYSSQPSNSPSSPSVNSLLSNILGISSNSGPSSLSPSGISCLGPLCAVRIFG